MILLPGATISGLRILSTAVGPRPEKVLILSWAGMPSIDFRTTDRNDEGVVAGDMDRIVGGPIALVIQAVGQTRCLDGIQSSTIARQPNHHDTGIPACSAAWQSGSVV